MSFPYPLADAVTATLAGDPERVGVLYEGRWRSWLEVRTIAQAVDARLREAEVDADLAVGLVLRNQPTGYAALVSLVAAGRTVVLINPFQAADAIAADVAKLKLAAIVAAEQDWSPPVVQAARQAGSGGVSLDEAAGEVRRVPGLETRQAAADHYRAPEVAVQMLTSGTTGAPKRVPLSRHGLSHAIADQVRAAAAMGESSPDRGLAATLIQYAPMVQLSGLFNALQAAFEGKPLALMDKFSPQAWIGYVRECRQTMLALPPAMMRMILEADPAPEDLASLRAVRSGAAPLDAQTRDSFEQRYGAPVLGIYGATEFVGPVAGWSLEDHAAFGTAKRGSVGRIWPQVASARVIDVETGQDLGRGVQGLLEVLVRRASPEWIRTNDLATIDEDGFLYIHGRADDAINRGGFKIPPDVISDALRTHPAVYDAAAVGLPDKRLGRVPAAAVELRSGVQAVSEDELMSYARSRLIAYQVPVRILIVPELPRTPAQKISRPGVYELFEAQAPSA
jgi:acyl-CoA synthetase (AMP-forming)/AMP-acid ligase II